ncbi:MAG: DUF1858 domain-containing protein [Lachnospiraceae bacterium]|nr:DUF1858 domain-containing protein [Lachnospiraceae bacterium]
MVISKDMLMGDILDTEYAETIANILMAEGMHCVGCPSSLMESLEDACMVHGIDVEPLLTKINAAIA